MFLIYWQFTLFIDVFLILFEIVLFDKLDIKQKWTLLFSRGIFFFVNWSRNYLNKFNLN